jgi:hypothetical protein
MTIITVISFCLFKEYSPANGGKMIFETAFILKGISGNPKGRAIFSGFVHLITV